MLSLKQPRLTALSTLGAGLCLSALACGSTPTMGDGGTQGSESTQGQTESGPGETTDSTESGSESGEPEPADYTQAGPYLVGNLATVLADPEGQRDLSLELWFPASGDATGAGQSLLDFARDDAQLQALTPLVEQASDECVRKQTTSEESLVPNAGIPGPWPTLVFSHCYGCTRFSAFSIAERLASWGFLVVGIDHEGTTLFDQLDDALTPLDEAGLILRAADATRVIDALLDPSSGLPEPFAGLADPEALGMWGHSFGAVTTGKLLQDDERVLAGVAIAAPVEQPLLPGVSVAEIEQPLMMFVAVEDNSITEFGNNAIRMNFAAANSPAWKLEFADTGHFAFADIVGLDEGLAAGCGEGERQTDGTPFSYHDPYEVRALAADRVTAFFAYHLLGDEDALAQLEAEDPLLDIQAK